jgi:5-methylcytosine-specific restriction endonuclease McrA
MEHRTHDRIRFYAGLSDADLLAAVESNNRNDRQSTIELIASLAELDERRLYLGLGYSSLYTYCREHLRLSEHEAQMRMDAARAAWRFPMVLDLLMAGDLTMTTASILKRWLTEENCHTLLEAARRKSKREVEVLVSELGPAVELDSEVFPVPGGYRIEVTIDAEAYRALQRLQERLRHSIPSGAPGAIVAVALKTLLRDVERRTSADVHRPRANGLVVSHTRHVPAAVKRAVWARDKGQCAFVGSHGRCSERGFLELHQVVPYSAGGPTTAENLQLRCRAHNVYEAELAAAPGP